MQDSIFKQSFFEIFSQPISTTVDMAVLKEKNRQLQQQTHPDRFATSSDEEKRQAMQITSLINEAFNTLKSPVSRIQYMLTLKGVDMDGETDTSMDGAFLMEQMELREDIANIRSKTDPLDALEVMASNLKIQSTDLLLEFDASFECEDLIKGREIVRKLQFVNKAQKEIKDLTEQLEDELI